MSASSPDDSSSGGVDTALPPMTLLATLQTAWTVKGAIGERRAGRDPAAQQPAEDARAYLVEAVRELTRLHMQLLMAKVQATRRAPGDGPARDDGSAQDGGPAGTDRAEPDSAAGAPEEASARRVAAVRRFDVLMKLRRTGRLLHGAHQRLMSLYPAVSGELVEEARRCQGALAELSEGSNVAGDPLGEPMALFLRRLLSFAAWLEREV